jgi:hypothetical protein
MASKAVSTPWVGIEQHLADVPFKKADVPTNQKADVPFKLSNICLNIILCIFMNIYSFRSHFGGLSEHAGPLGGEAGAKQTKRREIQIHCLQRMRHAF